ncbi:MAG: TetR/AcrR family transcriptional regulator [Gemmatimonadota bacterium]
MPRPRFAELPAERQEALLGAAADEFVQQGYSLASVNRIIERAGISKGTLYYYFDDKEDLFGAVIEQALDRGMEAMGFPSPATLAAETYWESFRDMMRRSMDYLRGHEWYVRLLRAFHQFHLERPAAPAARRVLDQMSRYIHDILEGGQRLGVVRTDLPLPLLVEITLAVDAATDRWRLEHWDDFTHEERLRSGDAHIDLMRDMLHADNQGWEEGR